MSASGHPASGFSGVRRRIPRYSVAIPVDITVLRSGAPASIPGRSLDLGEGGVAAVLAAELQLGEWVAVEFQLPNASQALQTKAVVRHHNQLRCGFEFLGLSGDQRSMIRRWAGNSKPIPILEPKAPASQLHPRLRHGCNQDASALGGEARHACAPEGRPVPQSRAGPAAAADIGLVAGGWQDGRRGNGTAGGSNWKLAPLKKDVHAQPPAAKVPADVMERLLVRKVDPVYPEAARRANLQGRSGARRGDCSRWHGSKPSSRKRLRCAGLGRHGRGAMVALPSVSRPGRTRCG